MNVPRTIWVSWCHTCGEWLDETEDARSSAQVAVEEHNDHFFPEQHPRCRVEVIPFRVDRAAALRIVTVPPDGVPLETALLDRTAKVVLRPTKEEAKVSPFKTCACGRTFTRAEWDELPFVGVGVYEVERDIEEAHESRNCPCGSTLSRTFCQLLPSELALYEEDPNVNALLHEHVDTFGVLRVLVARTRHLERVSVAASRLRTAIQTEEGRAGAYSYLARLLDEGGS